MNRRLALRGLLHALLWLTIYVAQLLGTAWRVLPSFLFLMALALCADALTATGLLYHDTPTPLSGSFLGLLAMMTGLWASPIVINDAVVWARDRWRLKQRPAL